jgi:DNA helicase-2/ATP-dependent DNA helicase PcrA
LNSLIENLSKLFSETAKGCTNMVEALDSFVGINTIPIMSIHKSKGLEFDTIIFLGLEDGAFGSFQNQQDEDTCAFFVAMSRAKHKLIFTYSDLRLDKWNRPHPQATGVIKPLYDALRNSTIVQEIDFREITNT